MLGQLPDCIGLLTKLEYLDLHNNKLSGSIPTSISKLTKLKDFYVTDNKLLEIKSKSELQSMLPGCIIRI